MRVATERPQCQLRIWSRAARTLARFGGSLIPVG